MITPDSWCDCYDFGKRFKCAQTECIKIVVGTQAIPEDAEAIKLHGRRKSGRSAKAKRKYVIQDYAMNVANPDESDDYDMDDDANNNIDDARGHSSAVSGVDSSSSRSSSSASTVNSSALRQISDTMAGRSPGPSSKPHYISRLFQASSSLGSLSRVCYKTAPRKRMHWC